MVGPFGLVDDIEELSSIPSFEQENGVERFSVAEIAGVHAGQAIRDPHAVPEQVHPEPAARRSHEDPRSHLPRCGLYRDAGSVHYGAPRAVRMLARGPQPCVESVGPELASPMLVLFENPPEPVLVDDEMAVLFVSNDCSLVDLNDQSPSLDGGVEVVRRDLRHETVQVALVVVGVRVEVVEGRNHHGSAVSPQVCDGVEFAPDEVRYPVPGQGSVGAVLGSVLVLG